MQRMGTYELTAWESPGIPTCYTLWAGVCSSSVYCPGISLGWDGVEDT